MTLFCCFGANEAEDRATCPSQLHFTSLVHGHHLESPHPVQDALNKGRLNGAEGHRSPPPSDHHDFASSTGSLDHHAEGWRISGGDLPPGPQDVEDEATEDSDEKQNQKPSGAIHHNRLQQAGNTGAAEVRLDSDVPCPSFPAKGLGRGGGRWS